jgi:CTP:molybdopterin cytidylyltransferase MocA
VLFAADVFAELSALRGDRGAREVIERDARRVRIVDVALPAPVDVDEPAALAALEL